MWSKFEIAFQHMATAGTQFHPDKHIIMESDPGSDSLRRPDASSNLISKQISHEVRLNVHTYSCRCNSA